MTWAPLSTVTFFSCLIILCLIQIDTTNGGTMKLGAKNSNKNINRIKVSIFWDQFDFIDWFNQFLFVQQQLPLIQPTQATTQAPLVFNCTFAPVCLLKYWKLIYQFPAFHLSKFNCSLIFDIGNSMGRETMQSTITRLQCLWNLNCQLQC